MNKLVDYWLNQAAEARKKSEAAQDELSKKFWLDIARFNEALAANAIKDEHIEKFQAAVKEGGDGVAGFVIGVVLGENGRDQMEKLGGSTQAPERAGFEAGLRVRPLLFKWMVAKIFGAAGMPSLLKIFLGVGGGR